MKKILLFSVCIIAIALTACSSKNTSGNQNSEKKTQESSEQGKNTHQFTEKLPEFTLKDVHGKSHSQKDISKDGLVLVVTAPTMKNKDEQEGWGKYLDKNKSDKATLVFLQDMDASSFKGKAKKEMKKESEAGEEPILLLDEKGEVRQKLKVKKEETVVLVYNNDGKLVFSETEKPSSASAAEIWKAAKD